MFKLLKWARILPSLLYILPSNHGNDQPIAKSLFQRGQKIKMVKKFQCRTFEAADGLRRGHFEASKDRFGLRLSGWR
jgi:hypothetical protein